MHTLFVGLRPVIQILCHELARGWGRWLRYSTEAKAEVKYRASARIRGPKHDTRFEWPVSILIMTRHPFLPFKTHKTSAKNPRLLAITGAIWFCRYRQCTPSQLRMHYGINGHILKWISEFLSGRTQCVVVDGAASSWSAVESGCRRGPFSAPCCSSFISTTHLIVLSPRSVYSRTIVCYIEPLRVFLINWLYKVT